MARPKGSAARPSRKKVDVVDACEEDYEDVVDYDEEGDIPAEENQNEEKLPEPPKITTMQAELKYLEKRYTKNGNTYYAEQIEEIPVESVNWWQLYALCVTHHMDRENKHIESTSLQVNSEHLKELLRDVIGSYPALSFHTNTVSLTVPAHCLYHYRAELKEEGSKRFEPASEAAVHVNLLLNFIEREFEDEIAEHNNLHEQGLATFDHLWTSFKPGVTIYGRAFGQDRAFTLQSYSYAWNEGRVFRLNVEFVDFDGNQFGLRSTALEIREFTGAESITSLSAYPFDLHHISQDLRTMLIARGGLFEDLAGQNFRCYRGVAIERVNCQINLYNLGEDSRVMVDTKTFHRLNANQAFAVNAFSDERTKSAKRNRATGIDNTELFQREEVVLVKLSDEQKLLANATVRGFSFVEKRWLEFFVESLTLVDWNTNCFDKLVLPKEQKDVIHALVIQHSKPSLQFDDIVKGKGKGLISVLHGPPGVGKTTTAECVAEFAKRPLYMVSSGELGLNSSELDRNLTRILDMASTWKAVLLIDEADVFLERRSLHDMARNSLVSIFLRVLEYYEGIMFLTTNRVQTFDDAFKSRIHVPLKYSNLDAPARRQIWKNFLSSETAVNDADLDKLSEETLNGRQIKNIVRTAKSLAAYRDAELDLAQLADVVKIQRVFEADLEV